MKRIPLISVAPAASVFEPIDLDGERDLRLLDAFYHERAMDAAEAPSWNSETEQLERLEQEVLLAKLLALPTRRS